MDSYTDPWGKTPRVKLESNAIMPYRAYPSDAGYDLSYHGAVPFVVSPGAVVDIPCGVAVQWPEGHWGLLVGRSSTFRNRGLLVNIAVIDGGFRGELFAICRNITHEYAIISPGERIAQIIPLPLVAESFSDPVQVLELDDTERGVNGFGSSGA